MYIAQHNSFDVVLIKYCVSQMLPSLLQNIERLMESLPVIYLSQTAQLDWHNIRRMWGKLELHYSSMRVKNATVILTNYRVERVGLGDGNTPLFSMVVILRRPLNEEDCRLAKSEAFLGLKILNLSDLETLNFMNFPDHLFVP